jgi:DNA-binding MarR family transcriptional regulator
VALGAGAQVAALGDTVEKVILELYPRRTAASRSELRTNLSPPPAGPSFTPKQGQYLAFIYAYTRVLGRSPAEADLQRHFGVSPPSVHQMVLTLERAGLIRRQPGIARSIEVLIAPEFLPILR